MADFLGVLDSRERATLTWFVVALTAALLAPDLRSSLISSFIQIMKILFHPVLLLPLAAMTGYVSLLVFGLERTGYWETSLTKDTVVWFFGPAMLIAYDSVQLNGHLRGIAGVLLRKLRLSLVLEFMISFFVLNFFLELALIPILLLLFGMLIVSEGRPEYAAVRGPLEGLVGAIGLALLAYALAMLLSDFSGFAGGHTFRLFTLPFALTALFSPFAGALALQRGR